MANDPPFATLNHVAGDLGIPSESALLRIGISRGWFAGVFAISDPHSGENDMDEYFAAIPVNNATVLCVGGVTRAEAQQAQDSGIPIDGHGYYLFLANVSEPRQPIQLLAKFFSEFEAGRIARLLAPLAVVT
jgi:hypothetical protein